MKENIYYETSIVLVREERELYYDAPSTAFSTPDSVREFLLRQLQLDQKPQEEMWVLMLDTKNKLIGYQMISRGTLNSAPAAPCDIFRPAILANARSIILAHQHPSGDSTPSSQDMQITKCVKEAGDLLSICLLDHLIVGTEVYSFKENGGL